MSAPTSPAQRLARLANNYRIANDHSTTDFFRQVPIKSYSSTLRILTQRPTLSVDALAIVAKKFALLLNVTSADLIDALYHPDPNHDRRIAEFLLPTPWPAKARPIKQFAEFLVRRLSESKQLLYFSHFAAPWIAPPALRLRTARCGAVGASAQKLKADMIVTRAIQEAIAKGTISRSIDVPVFHSELAAALSLQPPFDQFSEAQISELWEEFRHSYLAAASVIDDNRLTKRVWSYFDRFAALVYLDDRFLAKQLRGCGGWLVFDAEDGNDVRTYIETEGHFLTETLVRFRDANPYGKPRMRSEDGKKKAG